MTSRVYAKQTDQLGAKTAADCCKARRPSLSPCAVCVATCKHGGSFENSAISFSFSFNGRQTPKCELGEVLETKAAIGQWTLVNYIIQRREREREGEQCNEYEYEMAKVPACATHKSVIAGCLLVCLLPLGELLLPFTLQSIYWFAAHISIVPYLLSALSFAPHSTL